MKLVINRCFGGFSLSERAIRRYAEIKGLTLYPEQDERFKFLTTYWLVPPDQRPVDISNDWMGHTVEERLAYNREYDEKTLDSREIPRNDPALVQVVEELGGGHRKGASGAHADLAVVEIPDGIDWEIAEYDGNEHVAEKHQIWS